MKIKLLLSNYDHTKCMEHHMCGIFYLHVFPTKTNGLNNDSRDTCERPDKTLSMQDTFENLSHITPQCYLFYPHTQFYCLNV